VAWETNDDNEHGKIPKMEVDREEKEGESAMDVDSSAEDVYYEQPIDDVEEEEEDDDPNNNTEETGGDQEDEDGDGDNEVDDDDDDDDDEIVDSQDDDDNEEGEDEADKVDGDKKGEHLDLTLQADRKTPTAKKRDRYHVPKIFQDAVTVLIPLDVTADLKIAIQKTRAKRMKSIYKRFPTLQSKSTKHQDDDDSVDAHMGYEDDENGKEKEKKKAISRRKKLEHIPQPDQFGSVLDYLEAKYVKGVMLNDNDDEGPALDDNSEGQGSVYSKDSFLDDTDLQRDVAEQVMASTTMTKVELEQDDGDFFVNVGNLELENDEYGENYDPLQDKENGNATKKKRKQPTVSAAIGQSPNSTTPSKKMTKASTPTPDESLSVKSKKSIASSTSTKSKKSAATSKDENEVSERSILQKEAKKTKARLDNLYKKGVAMIKKLTDEELPKRKTKLKVALTCPPNKKPGDDITFSYVRVEV
jgi:hypothetical protein